ncbi:16S rRNA (guanine(527)-N(7))-methyltransferase RsmG [Facilibium subflavum]|uniref:16S rRNA (guanine(527)-N(7))-methyltransferase RsmG n=1 Tax=Facilibium subflavum TaxID=2219058 RepID=UPI0038B2CD43
MDCLNDMMGDRHVQIRQAVEKLGLQNVNDAQIQKWLDYLSLLQKWNKTYNMTSITAMDDMLVKHLFDSLSLAPFLPGEHIIDVGTGGGLPGVPLAILMPEKTFVLVDSVGKKIRFLNHVKKALKLDNITPLNIRIEAYKPEKPFDHVVSRAFSSLSDFYRLCQHLLTDSGTLLAMKGAKVDENELQALPVKYEVKELHVPMLEAQRHVVIMHKNMNR